MIIPDDLKAIAELNSFFAALIELQYGYDDDGSSQSNSEEVEGRMKVREIYRENERWYNIKHNGIEVDYPSVNTVLAATEPVADKKRLRDWKFKQAKKFLAQNRTCLNCQHLASADISKTHHLKSFDCLVGEKLRSPLDKKHRCKAFEFNAEWKANEEIHRTAALTRGSATHESIEHYFKTGDVPTDKFSKQITFLLKNLDEGKLYVEEPVWSHRLRTCGRMDFCGLYQEQVIIADWTTTGRDYIQREYYDRKFIQCAGYAISAEETLGIVADELIVVVMAPNKAELFREPVQKWVELWEQRVEQFWTMQCSKN